MLAQVEKLAFDTELLNQSVGRIEAADTLSPEQLKDTFKAASADGYTLLYLQLGTSHPSSERIVQEMQRSGHFVCGKVTYRTDLNKSVIQILRRTLNMEGIARITCSAFAGEQPTPELTSLCISSGTLGRFGVDPNMPGLAFRALYTKWMENSVAGKAADVVLVAREAGDEERIVGMVTVRMTQGAVAQICLLAVAETHRRRGLGSLLMVEAFTWAIGKGAVACTVATQTANAAACALYERCGGLAVERVDDFHFWIGKEEEKPNDPMSDIPNNKPYVGKRELENIEKILRSSLIQTHYNYGPKCEAILQRDLGVDRALLVGSATGALEICAMCVGAEPGVEVIVPDFTFVSTALAFVTHGATPVLVDIRSDTQNIDETKIEAAITSRTRAICVVHYAGIACEMDTIMAIAKKHKLMVVEDNAHGVYGSYKGRMLGSIGDVAALSFHYTKNLVCGEGGALLINNPEMIQTAYIAWEKGTNRMDFLKGKVDKYAWVGKGGSFVLSEICAAMLHAQLEERVWINSQRMAVWEAYQRAFESLEQQGKLARPFVPPHVVHNAHLYYIRVHDKVHFARLQKMAQTRKIGIFTHYHPLHVSPGAAKYARSMPCPESLSCWSGLLRLPLWVGLTDAQIATVVELVQQAVAEPAGAAVGVA